VDILGAVTAAECSHNRRRWRSPGS
jgi:hypothetical protein